MSRLLKAAAALLCAVGLTASASVVTATVKDTDGQTWNGGSFVATLTIPGQPGVNPTIGGVAVTPLVVRGSLSAAGLLSGTFTDTSTVDQKAVWVFSVCANASAPAVTVTTTVIGSTPNLSPAFSQLAPPRFPAGPNAFGYLDAEVISTAVKGSTYYNVVSQAVRQWNGAGWTGGTAPLVHIGASAEWAFNTGSGTTLPDVSGSNACSGPCDGTFVGSGMTWLPTSGIQFTNLGRITTPIQTWKTVMFKACSYVYPIGLVSGPSFNSMWGSSSSTTGVNLFAVSAGTRGLYAFTPELFDTAHTTFTTNIDGGCHVYAATLDTVGHLYKDGVELAYGGQAAATRTSTTPGFYAIGSGNGLGTGFDFDGILQYGEVYLSTILTPAQILAETNYINSKAGPPANTVIFNTARAPQLVTVGDSITQTGGSGATNQWPGFLTLNNTYTVTNYGSGGDTICNIGTIGKYRDFKSIAFGGPSNVVVLFAGTNDITGAQLMSAADTWGCMKQAITDHVATGAKVIVGTMLDRTTFQTQKNAYNTLIRANVTKLGAYLADVAENPSLGADGACSNVTFFSGDCTHPNNTGQTLLATAFSTAINSADGSTEANPDSITATATLTAAQNVVVANCAANCTITLPPCDYQTGTQRVIINPQVTGGTKVITVAPNGTQLINGANASVTVANLTTMRFLDVLTGPTTGGCSWVIK